MQIKTLPSQCSRYILQNTGFDGRVWVVLRVQIVAQAPKPKERNIDHFKLIIERG